MSSPASLACVLCGAESELAVLCSECLEREWLAAQEIRGDLFLCRLCGVRHLRAPAGEPVAGRPRRRHDDSA